MSARTNPPMDDDPTPDSGTEQTITNPPMDDDDGDDQESSGPTENPPA